MSTIPNSVPSGSYFTGGNSNGDSSSSYYNLGQSSATTPNLAHLFASYDNVWDENLNIFKMVEPSENPYTELESPQFKHEGIAFYALRNFNVRKKLVKIDLVITSTHLCDVLNTVLSNESLFLAPNTTKVDPRILYNYLDDLENYEFGLDISDELTPLTDGHDLAQTHLTALISFLETKYRPDKLFAESLLTHNPPYITYDLLWLLYKPKTLLIRSLHHPQLSIYNSMEINSSYIKLDLAYIAHDGEYAGYCSETLLLYRFDGIKKVSELSLLPFEYHTLRTQIEASLERRGRKYIDTCRKGKQYVCRAGMSQDSPTGGERLLLDTKTYSMERRIIEGDKRVIDLNAIHYQLCTPYVWGYSIENQGWRSIHVDDITDIVWKEEMLDNVILDQVTKTMIKGLVDHHDSAGNEIIRDIMPGKGTGLIMLFSGPPGIGKTLIAEAVAEATHRPIHRITTNDLGCDPEELEENLTLILKRGAQWNLILLLDEADVFLEQRTSLEIKRNSLVSIFLRKLEYYTGILILTTNRMGAIDRALESRIHFNLRFPEMNKASRIQLWQLFLKDISTGITHKQFQDLAEFKLNGRMIKHAASLGLALSKIEGKPLTFTHIKSGLRFIDPSLSIEAQPDPSSRFDDYNCASPLDPGMTPRPITDVHEGSMARDIIHSENSHRRQAESIGQNSSGTERGQKRARRS